ncbi:UNVERIFIED_CONTAM: hypothetical protein Sradi_0817500 [Sesamum radiatum]|uniref:Uncharacterized protein n=1 Tax=Sesamum radiatum TaxID=300843 RepID=A0AAW2VT03_SESRA
MGDEPARRTCMIQFLVVDSSFAYNVVFGRPGLNVFRAVVLTYHLKLKFPTKGGIGEVRCDQREARQCYNLTVKKGNLAKVREKRRVSEHMTEGEDVKKAKPKRIEPAEKYKEVELVLGDPEKTTRIVSQMSLEMKTMTIDFLRKNRDMFAWSPSDFQGINPKVIVHRLNIDPQARPVKQKKHFFGVERNKVIEEEVAKLLKAGYITEIQCTSWLSNVVIVPKALRKWHMCTDFTDLNKACPKDPYRLP